MTHLYPLTSPQREIWFEQQLHEGIPLYNIGGYVKIPGAIDPRLFEQAVNLLVQKHDTLRTVLTAVLDEDGIPLQTYVADLAVTVAVQDVSAAAQPHEAAMTWMQQRFVTPFQLTGQPLFRYDLLKLQEDCYYGLFQYHHLIIDGYGVALLHRSLADLYTQLATGQVPNLESPSYTTFIDSDRAYVASETFDKQRQYWLTKYPTRPEPLFQPRYRSQYTQPLIGSGCEVMYLPRDFYNRLLELAKQHNSTLFQLLLGALYVYFTRTAQRDDLAIGLPVLNRANAQFKQIAGLFTGVSPTWFKFGRESSFVELLQQIKKTLQANYRHQRFPVSEINRAVGLGTSRSQLFDLNLSFENHDYDARFNRIDGYFTAMLHPWEQTPLMLFVRDFHAQAAVKFDLVYNQAYFNTEDIKALPARLVTILEAVLTDSELPIRALPIMTESELQQLQAWNDTAVDYPQDLTIVDLFEQQVARTPTNIAVVFEEQHLTYQQLNDQANQLAHYLLARQTQAGIQTHNPLVAIAVERSFEMVIGLLGILKAGGAYVPIDPSYPRERLRYLLEDSATPLLLTQSHLQAQLPTLEHDCVMVCVDEAKWADQPTAKPDVKSQAEDLAYVIYTSGSTGKPKGVMVEHYGASNLTIFQQHYFHTNADSQILQFASLSFDAATWEILMSVGSGATLQLVTSSQIHTDLITILQKRAVTHITLPPSVLHTLNSSELSHLQYVIVAGEACSPNLVMQWAQGRHFINAYGPTETTVCASVFECRADGNVPPIGKPIVNTRIYILDAQHQPQPPGLPGELCIAGRGLARGYLHRPELTADKFIEVELFGKTERVYKTGDLARWLPDGNLEYLGRLDHQVKLRGFRIELGEIEAVLSQHEAVKEAVVTLNEADGNKRLVAYLTTATEVPPAVLKEWLKARLPDYMIPSQWVVLAKLPLTPNGKIDRKALPAPDWKPTDSYEAPRNEIEQQLAQIWSRLLKQTNVSIHDNFFNLGGDSILSIQIVAQARQAGFQLTPRDLFQHQTIADLATVVRVGVATEAEQGLVRGAVPLTPIQHWFFAQEFPEYWHFNQSLLLCVPTDLQLDALRQAFAAVLSHHDALRLRYTEVDGAWQQTVSAPEDTVPLVSEDLRASPDPVAELSRLTQDYQARLNLTTGPVTYLVFCQGPASAWLFWCIHHLVVDGVSWRILQADLHQAYTQLVAGQRVQLPAKTSSFQAWAKRLVQYASSAQLSAELAYWQALPSCTLPREQETGENRLEHQQNYTITLTPQETEALLRAVPMAYQTRINDVLLTALALALADWTGQDRCLLDLEGHGRVALFEELDLSRTVGWFTTIYPVALTLPTRADLGTALKAIKEQLRGIPQDGIGYGLLTQLGGQVLPKGEILFNYLGQFDFDTDTGEFSWASESTGSDVSLTGERDHLIDINGAITQGSLQLTWSYSGACYQAKTIQTLADGYQAHLQQLIRHGQSGRQGVTPSDFPLATVTQATLDTLYQQYVGLQDLYPLSPMQQGMLFHTLYEPETGAYFEQLQWTLSNLAPTAFQAAWQHQLERHPILRTAFLPNHTPLLQVVQAQVPLPWREQDWRELAQAEQQSQLQTLLRVERTQGFDFSQAPLMRFDLIRVSEQRYVFIQQFHHILLDGWCLPIILSEVRDSYRAFQHGQTPQLPPVRPYRDYIAWLQRQDHATAQHYWQQRLAGLAAPTPWPILTHPTATPAYRDVSYALSPADTQRLQRFSQTQRVTLNTLVQGAWAVLLSRYSRDTVVCFGVTVSGRHAPVSGIEQMMGLFINTLPLLVQTPPTTLVKDYLQQVQSQHQNDQRYAYSPLFEIQQVSEVPNGTALFDSLLVFENYPLGKALEPAVDSFQLEDIQGIEYTNYPLTVAMVPGEALSVKVTYDHHRLHLDAIERLWGHFQTLLLAMSDHPEQSISQLPMLTESELQQLQAWNDTAVAYPQDLTIVDLFEQQVAQTPDNIAVVFENQQLTYQQLNDQANQLAHYLLARQTQAGIPTHNPLTAIAVERSVEMVIGLLGILKAGGAYVPIDPSYPRERLRYLLEDSAAPLLLTQSHLQAQLPTLEPDCVVVCLDEAKWADQPTSKPAVKSQAEDLAYVIYTSGSTGKPKGAMNTHSGIVNRLWWMQDTYQLTSQDRVLQKTPFSFDVSVWEFFWPLVTGAGLVLARPAGHQDPSYLTLVIATHQVTVLHFVPSMLAAFLSQAEVKNCRSLKRIICSGEALSLELTRQVFARFQEWPIELHNLYGPTEAAVDVSHWTCRREDRHPLVPIGKPVANTQLHVLDANHQMVPIGVPGELGISGVQVCRGYLNRPELTAEKFIEVELFGKPERLYKTGDLARWLPDGNLEYLGRLDHQVKLRGFRIELGEIEAVLSQHEAVKEAVVTLNEAEGNPRLVAYLTTAAEVPTAVLKEWLKARLPDYMIPSQWVVLAKLPLTPNGKIDRKALPAPDWKLTDSYEAPRNEMEQQLAQIWSRLLKQTNVSIHDNFFNLGGDSILSIQIVAQARQAGFQLTPRDLFQHQTIAELATVVRVGVTTVAEPNLIGGEVPLTPIQHWFFAQEYPEYWHFNQSLLLRVPPDLQLDTLRQALVAVLSHHDMLRSRYTKLHGTWQQTVIPPEDRVPLLLEDLRASPDPVAELSRLTQDYQARLNLTTGPVTYLVFCQGPASAWLFWCIHHLVVDGVSWRILQADLHQAYTQLVAGQRVQLPAKTSSFQAWAKRLVQYASSAQLSAELAYWQALPSCTLPREQETGENRLEHQQNYTITLTPQETEALLRAVPMAYQTRINDVLLTALALALADWTGQDRCLLDLEGHGRVALFEELDLSRTVGWFTTIYPVALTLPTRADLGTALKAIKEQLRGIPQDGIGYGLLTQLGGQVLPKGEILFNYLGQFDFDTDTGEFSWASESTGSDVSLTGERDHLIDINGAITQGSLQLTWSYSGACYQAKTIQTLADGYQAHLQQLIRHGQSGRQGVTPSDFPLATVTQATLDTLYQQYVGLQDLYPLSPMQQGMLFHTLYEPETGAYFEQLQWTLSNLAPTAFQAAWQHQLERHPILRTAFLPNHTPLLQVVQAQVPLPWREQDWRELAQAEQQSQLQTLLRVERTQGFDFSQAPLMRFDLIRVSEQRYVFIQQFHHILLDGWCLPIILSEVRDSYRAFQHGQTPQLPPVRPYRDYIAWLQRQDHATAQHYWQQRLAGLAAPTPWPILTHPTATPAYRDVSYALSPADTQRLQRFSQTQRVTLNTLVQGAWAVLLSRYSRDTVVCFGVTVSGRHAPLLGIEQMMGLFINTLPLLVQTPPATLVKDYLQQVQTQHQNDQRYAYSPLFEIQQVSEVPNGTALFDSLLVFENYPLGKAFEPPVDSFQLEDIQGIEYTNYPLTVAMVPGESLSVKVTYDHHRLHLDAIERLWGHFQTLLLAMSDHPEQSISQLPMLTAPELQQLQAWNDTAVDYPQDLTIVDLFEQQVARTPANIAVVFENQHLTYQQLNDQANQLAHYLLARQTQASIPTHNPLIAIAVERSLEMVIGLLGILKAGGAYVPIDPSYPRERIRYLLTDSATPLLLTQSHLQAQLPTLEPDCVVVCVDEAKWADQPTTKPAVKSQAEDLAYVIYTSGSTGKPKGVMVEHQALTLHGQAMLQRYVFNNHDKVLQFASMSFDTSIEQLLVAWLSGASVVLVKNHWMVASEFLAFLKTHALTVANLPPGVWQQLLELETLVHELPALRMLILGGEALLPQLVRQTRAQFPTLHLVNAYGPTESVITSTSYRLPVMLPENTTYVPIGRPRANTRIYILDAQHQPQPPGLPGELCIAGRGLARGYLHRPELTADKFIEVELFGKPERVYKTGDLARWLPDGNLEYLGRLDHQVKLRGFRIELGEIEAVLSQHEAVKEAVVILNEAEGNPRLVAYLTTATEVPTAVLKEWLKARLPDYMIPSQWVVLEKLPLTPNGKIDRKALPSPVVELTRGAAPATPTEALLATLWANVLKRETIQRQDNFFELGGHSLLATQLIARIRDSFQVELPVRAVFEHPQLADLSTAIETATGRVRLPPIVVQSATATNVLSFAQQRLWFLNQLLTRPPSWSPELIPCHDQERNKFRTPTSEERGSSTYNMPVALRLSGPLAVTALQDSLHWLVARHDSLRTVLPTVDGQAQVWIQALDNFEVLRIQDLRSQPTEAQPAAIQRRINQHALAPFDLAQGPLFKAELLLLEERQAVLLLNWHHIISDGWSMGVFIREWKHAYTAFSQGETPSLPPLAIQYQDYAAWQRQWLQGEVLQQQLEYWRNQLAGLPEVLDWPTAQPRPAQLSYQGAHYAQSLSTHLTSRLTQLSQQQGVTVFMTWLSVFYLLLSRYARQDDIAVGSPIANRTHSQTENLLGFFVNTLVLRGRLSPWQTFLELLRDTRHTCLAAYTHQDLPFEMLVEQLQPTRSLSHSPLFQVMLVLQNNDPVNLALPGLEITTLEPDYPLAKFDLTLSVEEREGQFHCDWEYATDLFDADTIARMADRMAVLLTAIVENPTQVISQLPMLTTLELQQLQAWNDTAVAYPQDLTMVDLFEQQVARTPANIAVVFEEQQLTYQQLNDQANQLAHYLLARQTQAGIPTHNPLIAIAVERSLEMVIGLLGILKAGGAYVPIDPSYPRERLRYLLEDSATPLLLTQSHLQAQLPTLEHDCVVVCLDEAKWADQPTTKPDVKSQAEDLAYVIYTSGSTGKPKGVMVEHHGLSNLLLDMQQRTEITASDKLLAVTTLSFDIAALELYLPLISGSPLYLATAITANEGLTLPAELVKHKISFMQATPATWQMLKHGDWQSETPLTILCGGEALPLELANYLFANHHRLWNVYGPTETTIWSTAYLIQTASKTSSPIGHPIANTRIYILDAQHQPQPPGLPGELCIAGRGLARGYLHRPELTAEKFIEVELFGKPERLYKTGDLARWLPDGDLEYLGRLDHQVKLRGFRIELGEIEAVLSQHDAVTEAVVTLNETEGNPRLVAYLTTATEVPPAVLKEWLKARLPDYMIPSQWVVLEKLPLTPNGKIDRKALPSPVIELTTGAAPATPTEALLATLWANVLKRETIQRQDNFFELGGHSLLATQLVARIRDSFQVELPVRAVFEHPQLADLSTAIEMATGRVRLPPIVVQPATATNVLSFAQQRLWFLNQLLTRPPSWSPELIPCHDQERNKFRIPTSEERGSSTYNMPVALRLSGPLAVAALQDSLHWLVARHDSLRMVLPTVAGQAQVWIQSPDNFEVLRIQDLRSQPTEAQPAAIQRRINQHALAPFDLAQGPLFKAELLLMEEQQAVLLLNWHHIISDGWSMGVFIREWQHAYTAFAQGETPSLPPLAIQYQDYAAWQRQWLRGEVLQQQLDYWRNQLAGLPEVLDWPTAQPRPAQLSYQGAYYAQSLSAHLTSKLTQLSQQQGVTVFMTWLSAFYLLLSRYARQDDIAVGSPIANRTHSQTETLIGFFVNTLVLRGRLQPQQTFLELLRDTRHTCLAAYAHQDLPFEMLVEQLQPTRSLSHSPLFQVMLVLQNNDPVTLALPGLEIATLEPDYPLAKFDLTLSVEEREGQFHCSWEYATDLFAADTIARMADRMAVLLTAIVENPTQVISRLPMLTAPELQQLQAWNDTAVDYPQDLTIVDLFEQQVARTPNHIALVFENQQLTYQQLNDQANQLAHYLLARQTQAGIHLHNPLIAIAVERSLEMVIGLLGILKAGGAYVPIDPSYPRERLRYLLEDSAAPLLLTQSHLQAQLPTLEPDCVVVCVDEAKWADQPTTKPAVKSQAEDLAYVIYTSGSTGKPKGVMIEHGNLLNSTQARQNYYQIDTRTRFLLLPSFAFDAFGAGLFLTLNQGGCLYLPVSASEIDKLVTIITTQQLTHLLSTPVLYQELLEQLAKPFDTWRGIILGGEVISPALLQYHWRKTTQVGLFNEYGLTEATIWSTIFQYQTHHEASNLIGHPIANTRIYILDAQHQPQPPGLPGELCIAGRGLARGYLHRPELTAEKFMEVELFGKPERIYKTGDLARWLPDGNLEYLGRLDHQVKLRGFRIELGEIEAVLSQHEAVKEAVVTLNEAEGNPRLVAYLTTATEVPTAVLKEWLKARLPDYMIPSQWVVLAKLPLTPNGKIDRQALPSPDIRSSSQKHYQTPRNTVELQLAQIWEQVLEVRPIGIFENFFELGGHSLLAVRLMAQIEQQFQKHLPLTTLFQHATIEQLATILRQQQTEVLPWSPLVAIQVQGAKPPLFCVHPGGGNVLCYVELAQSLGMAQPVYGLQAFGMEAGQVPYTQVIEIAQFYLHALQTLQPQGPYQLVGWSFGGLVAFEIARQLQTQGESVSLLALLDTVVPALVKEPPELEDDAQFLVDLFREEFSLSLEQLRPLTPEEQLTYVVEQGKQVALFPPEMDVVQARRLLQLYKTNAAAGRCYQPPLYQGPIILFQATEDRPNWLTEPDYGWQDYATAGVAIIPIPGNHENLVKSPQVQILAEHLKSYLK